MRLDWAMRVSLGVIAISLAVLAFRPVASPPVVKASADAFPFYVEPGVEMLRYPDGSAQVYGKVVVDLRTGKIWVFPTGTQSSYPIDTTTSTPPVSRPVYLGKYAFGEVKE
jgi:hypothetical protein